jgi:isopenicillin-N epimerase
VVALPPGVADTPEGAEALWHQLYAAGFVVPPVSFAGRGLLRLAAAPYNDEDDYTCLAEALLGLVRRRVRRTLRPRLPA